MKLSHIKIRWSDLSEINTRRLILNENKCQQELLLGNLQKAEMGLYKRKRRRIIFFLVRLKSKVNVRSLAKSNISPKSRKATIENQVLKKMRVSAGCKKDRGWLQKGRQENCIFMGRPLSQGGRARQTGYITWRIVAKTCTFRNLQIVERE